MDTSIPLVRYEQSDAGVVTLTLTRNALSDELLDDLLSGLERARDDDSVRVVVLASSHGRVFSAGGDLQGFTGNMAPVQEVRRARIVNPVVEGDAFDDEV